jgi:exonuclease SbcC
MIFNNLKLKNFKSHVNSSITFDKGVTLVIGENGAGKSSIFEAITFALFRKSTVKNLNDLINTGRSASDKTEMEVQLSFTANSFDYKVIRSIRNKSKKANAELIRINEGNEESIALGVREVDREIQEILRMDANTFLNAIHIRQGEISKLIDDTPAARKKLIGQLLNLEDLEKAYNKIVELINVFAVKKEILDGKLKDEDELETKLKEVEDEYKTFTSKINVLNEELVTFEKDFDVKNQEKQKLDLQKSKLDNIKISAEHEKTNLEMLNKRKEELSNKYNEILENEKEMEELKPFNDKLNIFKEFKDILIKLNEFKKEELRKKEIISKIQENEDIISKEQENFDKYNELDNEIKDFEKIKEKLNAEINFKKEYESNKNKISNNIEDYNKILDTFFNKVIEVLADFDVKVDLNDIKNKESLDNLKNIVENIINETKQEINTTDDNLKKYNDETIILSQEIKNSKKPLSEITNAGNKCPTCQSDINDDKKEELITSYKSTISKNEDRISQINQYIEELTSKKESQDKKLDILNSINDFNQYSRIIDDIGQSNIELGEIDKKILEIDDKQVELDTLAKDVESKILLKNDLEPHFKAYTDAQGFLNSQENSQDIQKQLDEIISEISKNENQLNELIKIDSDLSLDIKEEDLNNQISDLEVKNTRYNVLVGLVSDKGSYEEKIKINDEEIDKKKNDIEEIDKKIATCDYNEDNHNEISNQVEELTEKISTSKNHIVVYKKDLEISEDKIKDLKDEIAQNQKYFEEYKAVNEYLSLLQDFRVFYSKDGVQKDLRNQSLPLIQKYTKEFFEKFNFNYSDLSLNDEYDITITGPKGEVNLDMVSGGEKIAIALSLRLGITQVMSEGSIETILLDEPTIHLDSYRRQELINVLRSMSLIPQMIIVTHDEELETAANNIIKIEKEDGISKVIGNS